MRKLYNSEFGWDSGGEKMKRDWEKMGGLGDRWDSGSDSLDRREMQTSMGGAFFFSLFGG